MRADPQVNQSGETYPEEIVLLKKGAFYRRIQVNYFDWYWMFWDGGRQIAADVSPLHFMQVFALINVSDGKQVASFSIPQDPGSAPTWVRALQQKQRDDGAILSVARPDCRFRVPSAIAKGRLRR